MLYHIITKRIPAISDISGPVWIDLEIPEPVHDDEFVCDRCWLVAHHSREVFWQVCDECA